ncbi:glycosyltransferase [Flavobacterium sp. LB2P84]|uniref:glycosyltransferase family 2 protein n=1 Tax=Flavobacterium yafengii TaxID=3041253 RepID=UPI0024A8A75A|nr:glycosyltransferase [Flavobacterium yafengii]MDI6034448.1 glycosyltransferase [Flavobacterium yafengii]
MDNSLLFSIVIPTYNRSSDLVRCLNSLVSQTYKNFEVVVCDNASTDNTKEIIERYNGLLNLNYIYLTENSGGPAKPRNVGVANAKGEWVCFLDSDDWYTDNKLEYISNLNLDEVDFIYHDLNIIQNGVVIKKMKSRNLSKVDAYHDLLFNMNAIPTSSVCIKKFFFNKTDGFKEKKDIIGLEDFHLWINLAKIGTRFRYVSIGLGFYFIGNDNLTVTDERQVNRYKFLYQEFIDLEKDKGKKIKIKAALNYHIGWVHYKNKDFNKGMSFLVKSVINGSIVIKFRSVYFLSRGLVNILIGKLNS